MLRHCVRPVERHRRLPAGLRRHQHDPAASRVQQREKMPHCQVGPEHVDVEHTTEVVVRNLDERTYADDDFRRVLDVNVLGSYLAVRHLFPLLHAARGRIVLMSSETGWQTAMPFNGPYAMSKHAVEAFGDSLRRELSLLDMPVVKIQPGAFGTGMVASLMDRFERLADESSHYRRVLLAARKRIPQEERRAGDPDDLAALVER